MRAGAHRTRAMAFALPVALWACAVGAQQAPIEEIIEPSPSAPALKRNPRLPFYAPAAAAQSKRLSPEQSHERRFLRDLAASLQLQAQESKMVLSRTDHPAVRELAAAVMAWQQAIEADLLHLLHVRGMAPPLMDKAQARTLKQLRKLAGRASDRFYVEEIARARASDLVYFEETLRISSDPVLKQWIERQLAELRYQLTLAQRALPAELARPVQRAV